MASIPLPALHVQPPENPADQIGKMVQLRSLLNQQALQQQLMPGQIQAQKQALESGQLENQKQQQQLNDQKAMTSAMQDWDGKDYNALPALVLKKGGSATAVMGLKSGLLKHQQEMATLSKDQLANEKVKNDYLAQALENVQGLPPEQQGDAFEAAKAEAIKRGYLDPQQAQGMQYQGPEQLDLLKKMALGHANSLADAEKKAATSKIEAGNTSEQLQQIGQVLGNAGNAQDWSGRIGFLKKRGVTDEQLQQLGLTGDFLPDMAAKAKQLGVTPAEEIKSATPEKLSMKDWLAKNPGKGPSDYEVYMKKVVPAFNFNLQNAGATGTSGQPSAMAQAIASGSMKWQDAISTRTPMTVKEALLKEVKSINPNFNSGDFDVEKRVKISATSGMVGNQLLAIGTAREHMKTFTQLADALDNDDWQFANKIGNAFGVQFGSDKATNLKIAAQAFGGEVGRAFDGAGVVAGEREQAQKAYEAYLTKGQFKGAIQTVDKLLAGKQKSAHDWFDKGIHAEPDFGAEQPVQGSTGQTSADDLLKKYPPKK